MAKPRRLPLRRLVFTSARSLALSTSCFAISAGSVGMANRRLRCSDDRRGRRSLSTGPCHTKERHELATGPGNELQLRGAKWVSARKVLLWSERSLPVLTKGRIAARVLTGYSGFLAGTSSSQTGDIYQWAGLDTGSASGSRREAVPRTNDRH